MKILVDKMPEDDLDCLFSTYDCGYYACKIKNDGKYCNLSVREKCPYLKEIK